MELPLKIIIFTHTIWLFIMQVSGRGMKKKTRTTDEVKTMLGHLSFVWEKLFIVAQITSKIKLLQENWKSNYKILIQLITQIDIFEVGKCFNYINV